ncbi:MAG TPA: hypothetical protein VFQ80_10290 [Thermomicrobiales bacterium]|jgi:hypothetical protein|nr:hypothetical protein [Thermomicrobiales bacterium]
MRRRVVWVLPFAALLLASLFLPGRAGTPAGAQSGTPVPTTAGHPLVGAWMLDVDVADPTNPPSLAIFSSDGIYQQTNADGTDGFGVWVPTGDETANVTILFNNQENGAFSGTTKVRASVTLDGSQTSFTAPYTLEFIAPDGSSSGELGPATARGVRIEAETMGTPVGTIPAMEPAAATPAA